MHPTADTTALIFGYRLGRRVIGGVMPPACSGSQLMKHSSPIAFIFAAFLLVALADVCSAQSGCSLLDKGKRAQFITYDRYQDFKGLIFRLTNNTTCPITVERDTRVAPMRQVRRPDGKTVTEVFVDSRDGAVLDLHFLVQGGKRRRAPERGDGWERTTVYGFTDVYHIQAGQSALFSVHPTRLRDGQDIAVPFKYAWEMNDLINFGVGGVAHRVHFLNAELPAEAKSFIERLR
jgi:hypothetical protein